MSDSLERRPILLVTQTATPYNDALFSALAEDPGVDLEVWVMRGESGEHPWKTSWKRSYRREDYDPKKRLQWRLVKRFLGRGRCLLVSNGWFDPTCILLCLLSVLRAGWRVCFWTDCPVKAGRSRGLAKRAVRAGLLRGLFAAAYRVCGMGSGTRRVLLEMGLSAGKFVNLPCYVDAAVYEGGGYEAAREPIRLMSAGRLVDDLKGYSVLLDACAGLVRRGFKNRFFLRIAGTGPDEDLLRARARALELDEQVEFLGWREPDEMVDLFKESDVLVHPAYFEPYGLVIVEAMATGILVMGSTGTMAVEERVEDRVNGLVHKAGDAGELEGQLAWVLEHRDEAGRLAAAGRATGEEWPLERGVETLKGLAEFQ